MPTSPLPRCTRRSRTNTFAGSTSRPTRAQTDRAISDNRVQARPELVGAVLSCLAVVVLAAACRGDGQEKLPSPSAQPTPAPSATLCAPSTGRDEPPQRDLVDLARRLGSQTDPTPGVELPPRTPGDEQMFDVLDLPRDPDKQPKRATVSAALRATSEHAYFFVERGADVDDDQVDAAVRALEEDVWPPVTGAFGLPPTPGVDGDPRILILHADLGAAVGGYVSEEDAYPRTVVPHSNEAEIVYLNLSVRPLGSPGYTRVLAHELQHLVHRRLDFDEASWVNEGLSEIAAGLVGERATFPNAFLDQPDTQLNAWAEVPASAAHYGASSLFFSYLLEQTEGDIRRLAAGPRNGVDGVQAYLRASGSTLSFAELVADWAVANFLDVSEGPYGYRELDVSAPTTTIVEPGAPEEAEVHQFAADYLELRAEDFEGEATFVFEGETDVPVLAGQSEADGSFWWSNRGDSIDATLTRELDLTGVRRATLTYRTWFDIERWYDYGYVEASRDGGRTWSTLAGRQTTTDDPLEASYGPGYTGRSGGGDAPRWVGERIDLSAYAGSRVLLRFEYVTDDGLNEPGWAIDDIAVPEIGFLDDAESDVGGWHREGFQRLAGVLPQSFELRLITLGPAPAVEEISLDHANGAQVAPTGLGSDYQTAIIVIVGTTEGTTEAAHYRYEVLGSPGR